MARATVGTNILQPMFIEYLNLYSRKSLHFPQEKHTCLLTPHTSSPAMAVLVFQLLEVFRIDVQVICWAIVCPTIQTNFRKKTIFSYFLKIPAGVWKQYLEKAHGQKRLIMWTFITHQNSLSLCLEPFQSERTTAFANVYRQQTESSGFEKRCQKKAPLNN